MFVSGIVLGSDTRDRNSGLVKGLFGEDSDAGVWKSRTGVNVPWSTVPGLAWLCR